MILKNFYGESFQKCPKDVDLITCISVAGILSNRMTLLIKQQNFGILYTGLSLVMFKDCLLCSWEVQVFGQQIGFWLICWLIILNLECKISEKMHANCKFELGFFKQSNYK